MQHFPGFEDKVAWNYQDPTPDPQANPAPQHLSVSCLLP
jgi:hypothetical protein